MDANAAPVDFYAKFYEPLLKEGYVVRLLFS
jgi:hypothetical protein